MAITRTPGAIFAEPALTLGTVNAVGTSGQVIASNATVLAFDATVPGGILPRDAAAAGSVAVAARRDHVHGVPLTAEWFAMVTLFGG